MAINKYFRYKKGNTEIETDNSNKDGVRLAYVDIIMRWTYRIAIIIFSGKACIKIFIKWWDTG